VPGAILFDLLNGGEKDWDENPYAALGRRALDAVGDSFDLGSVGAGTGALTAMHKGGLGSASLVLTDGITVGALVAANPVGHVTTPNGYFWAAPFELNAEFGGLGPDPAAGLCGPLVSDKVAAMLGARANTTIAIVATDATLTKAQCHRLSVAAHDGIARAVVPAHTPNDGDLVFALSTGNGPPATDAQLAQIGHAAALCLSRAIARAVYAATPAVGDVLPCYQPVKSGLADKA
jgi:D-aminopeptidase